jgi:hypothetical protein
MGRAGAAIHPRSAVSSGQPGTTTPQVNPPVRWQANRPDLAYNDEVTRLALAPHRCDPPQMVKRPDLPIRGKIVYLLEMVSQARS